MRSIAMTHRLLLSGQIDHSIETTLQLVLRAGSVEKRHRTTDFRGKLHQGCQVETYRTTQGVSDNCRVSHFYLLLESNPLFRAPSEQCNVTTIRVLTHPALRGRACVSVVVLLQGGKTRGPAGPKSEGESYFYVADHYDWWGKPDLRARASTEDFARDSFENIMFSICRYASEIRHSRQQLVVKLDGCTPQLLEIFLDSMAIVW